MPDKLVHLLYQAWTDLDNAVRSYLGHDVPRTPDWGRDFR